MQPPLRTVSSKWRGLRSAVGRSAGRATALKKANSVSELQALVAERRIEGFNGQILRAKYLLHTFEAAGCTGFLETGTFHGATTVTARELFDTDVHTAELSRTHQLQARLRAKLARVDRIRFYLGDSRQVLAKWFAEGVGGPRPMVYLDAHWYEDLPLVDELVMAARQGSCVVVIDDFRVPGDDGFKYDVYRDQAIDLDLVAPQLPSGTPAYVPAHPARDETGARCGTLIAGIGLPALDLDEFPASLLRRAL